jgi:hypothetical protein
MSNIVVDLRGVKSEELPLLLPNRAADSWKAL